MNNANLPSGAQPVFQGQMRAPNEILTPTSLSVYAERNPDGTIPLPGGYQQQYAPMSPVDGLVNRASYVPIQDGRRAVNFVRGQQLPGVAPRAQTVAPPVLPSALPPAPESIPSNYSPVLPAPTVPLHPGNELPTGAVPIASAVAAVPAMSEYGPETLIPVRGMEPAVPAPAPVVAPQAVAPMPAVDDADVD